MIRRAELQDASAVLALTSAFVTTFDLDESAFSQSFVELVSDQHACFAVAEVDAVIAGYVLAFCHRTLYANGRVAWVEELMVDGDFRRRGIGSALMSEVERWSVAMECKLVALATRRAALFYKALGYGESAAYFRKLRSDIQR